VIAIVGGGLAGLTCAAVLARAGREFALYEASPVLGGRVAGRRVSGFVIDRGFQVFLDSYPALRENADIKALQPRYFDSGAMLWDKGRFWTLRNPVRHPARALKEIGANPFSVADKRRLVAIVTAAAARSDAKLLAAGGMEDDISILEFLRGAGVTPECIERFLRPFFGGVFLDNDLASSAALFRYYLKKFAFGRAFVPAGGVGSLPAQLAGKAGAGHLHTGVRVEALETSGRRVRALRVAGHGTVAVDEVVLATDPVQTALLLGAPRPDRPRQSVWTLVFAIEGGLYKERMIVLPAGARRLVRHFVQMTNVAPEYSASGREMVVATILEPQELSPAGLVAEAKREIGEVFRAAHGALETVEVTEIREAVFRQPPGFMRHLELPPLPENVTLAGEQTGWSCIESAMASGARAARGLIDAKG
jgi:phytoene dehydrogenase-like protein